MKKLIVVIIALCVFFTFFILFHTMARQTGSMPWISDMQDADMEILLENVYITDCSDGKIFFLYDGQACSLDGNMEENYTGIADIKIENQVIQKIYLKRDYIEGTLLGYQKQQIKIEGYGWVDCAPEYALYSDCGQDLAAISLSDLTVGSSELKYYIADGKICAVVKSLESDIDHIRVLIKNGSDAAYQSLYLCCDVPWSVSGEARAAGEVFDVVGYMEENALEELTINWEGCAMYLCDSKGIALSQRYEGTFCVWPYDREAKASGGVVLVNVLSVEDYVRYVLPSEMPESFSYEALKAQAVCARTFAYAQMNGDTYAEYGANLDDTTAYQVYNDVGTKELTDQAVADTRGEVIACDGELISCYYYSTSPGTSENMEVWQSDSPKYLVSRSFIGSGDINLSGEDDFYDFITGTPDSYDMESPFYRWSAVLDIAGAKDEQYGAVKKITVSKRSAAGFVTGLTVSCEYGSLLLENENEIRQFLGQYLQELTLADGSARTGFTLIPSACFAVSETEDTTISLVGGGFGHGIGMSQYGADAMGDEGFDYRKIIDYYYPGVQIVQISVQIFS